MAALQTLRNKPALLMSIIGGALLLFIITMVVENHNPFGPSDKAGKAFGQTIKITELNEQVEEELNYQEVSRAINSMLNGSNQWEKLSEQEREQIRQTVWQKNVQELALLEETNKLGLTVTDEELINYLKDVNFQTSSQEVQFMLMVGAAFGGTPTIEGYQQFLKNYDKLVQQLAQSSPEMLELVQNAKRACAYVENKLKMSILQDKYMILMQGSFISNPIAAKALFNEAHTMYDVEIAAVAYDSISEEGLTVTDEEYKELYKKHKEEFYLGEESRTVRVIDFQVLPSLADRNAIQARIKSAEDSLRKTNNVEAIKAILSTAESSVDFNNVYFTKDAYKASNMTNFISRADSLAVGRVSSYFADGRSAYVVKLVGKKTTADSLQYKFIPATTKAQADSIMNDLKGGKSWAEVAKSKNAKDTLIWSYNPVYVEKTEGDSGVYTHPSQLAINTPGILKDGPYYVVVQVTAQKAMTEKYNIAVACNEFEFSDLTYEEALSKMNNFVGSNKEAAKIEEAAKKAGYMAQSQILTKSSYTRMSQNYGDKAGEVMRWIFDEAKVGQVSNVFEIRDLQGNTHLLTVAVVSECGDDYMPWNDETVKTRLKGIAMQEKKAAKALEMVKNVKNMDDMKKVKGVHVENVSSKSVYQIPMGDPALIGALQKAKEGQFVASVKGTNAVYAIRVTKKAAPTVPYTEELYLQHAVMQNVGQQNQIFNDFFNYLITREGKVKDLRYKF
jgi:peptidyl-prolyl cis-trans isomerase D